MRVPPEEVKRDSRRPGWDPLTARGPGSVVERVYQVCVWGRVPLCSTFSRTFYDSVETVDILQEEWVEFRPVVAQERRHW